MTSRPSARRVLVVDDDASIRQFIVLALSDSGYEVTSAAHGGEALAAAEKAPPDVILLDMRMPVMDGWAFAKAYREQPAPHAPVVVLTAARDAAQSAAEISADGFLPKPFELRDLLRIVADFAGRASLMP